MVETMRSWLRRLFIQNWPRKTASLIAAMFIWVMISHSMTINRKIENIQVRVINLPPGKTIEGMKSNGILTHRIPMLSITGNKMALEKINEKDLEIVIDAQHVLNKTKAEITKRNLVSLNPEFDIGKAIDRIGFCEIPLKPSNLITAKVPIVVTPPIGDSPKGYQFLDIWPYQLSVTVTGPEETIQRLKSRSSKLTFNLNEISTADLDAIASNKNGIQSDEVGFPIPDSWKKIHLSAISEAPIQIEDPQAKFLRIDFLRQEVIPIGGSIPVAVFFPPKFSNTLNPETYTLAPTDFLIKKNGLKIVAPPLYAHGVSRLFVETVKDMMQLLIIAVPKSEQEQLPWNLQFIDPYILENRFVARSMTESFDMPGGIQPRSMEEVVRNRFRSYMQRCRLFASKDQKLSLKIELQANTITIAPQNL